MPRKAFLSLLVALVLVFALSASLGGLLAAVRGDRALAAQCAQAALGMLTTLGAFFVLER
jgi:hypothetical protein